MQITDVRATLLSVPTSLAQYAFEGNFFATNTQVIVEVETDTGLAGLGDAFGYGVGEAVASVVRQVLKPLLVGRDATSIRELTDLMFHRTHLLGRYGITTFAISGVELALWDLAGKRAGLPLYQLLGGAPTRELPAYASLVRYPEESRLITDHAAEAVQRGFTHVKLHQATTPSVRMAREVIGPDIPLTVDINCRWSTTEAIRMAEAFSDYDILWLEEPVYPPEDFEALHQVQASGGVPLSSGENLCTAVQFKQMMDMGAVTYVQPSLSKVGGVGEFLHIARLARDYNLELAPHSPYFGPAFVGTMHLIAATGQAHWVERFYFELEAEPFTEPLQPVNGSFLLPEGPGLGVTMSPEYMERYRVGRAG